jgi:8-oxo-dGTP pyrophosphatase MutT (NUDIX family)
VKSLISLFLEDNEWKCDYIDHDRNIARAIVFDREGYYYFVRADRDDDFGRAVILETAGGGVEDGEDTRNAVLREVREELGAEVEVLAKVGIVSDYYNLIHRHNINNYYLCRIESFGDRHLTKDEIECFKLSVARLRYDEAIAEYESHRDTPLGRLIANRELPILRSAREIIGTLSV